MKISRVALFEPAAAPRKELRAALRKAGLEVQVADDAEAPLEAQLVVLGPSLKAPERVARAARKRAPGVLVLAAQKKISAAPFADGVLPLPLSVPDLKVRLPELLKLQGLLKKKGRGSSSSRAARPPPVGEPVIDPLTQFYTFTHFKEVLFIELKRSRRYGLPLAVALVAFDPLSSKATPGLRAQLFGGLALAIRRSLRDIDMAVQYGSDRILVVMPHTDLAGALLVADRIRERVAKAQLTYDQKVLRPSVSVGLASTTPARELSFGEVAGWAQDALRGAQADGGNRVKFYDAAEAQREPLPAG